MASADKDDTGTPKSERRREGGDRTALDEAIDDLIRYLAEEAGISESEGLQAIARHRRVMPRSMRARRRRRRDLLLLLGAIAALLISLALLHLTMTRP